jgi:hypothetical protein
MTVVFTTLSVLLLTLSVFAFSGERALNALLLRYDTRLLPSMLALQSVVVNVERSH